MRSILMGSCKRFDFERRCKRDGGRDGRPLSEKVLSLRIVDV